MSTNGGLASSGSKNQSPLFIPRNGGDVEPDTLNTLVTGAIWRAEQLEAQGLHTAPQAWAEVSSLEEELAKALPVSESEGRIARRGAVRAALKASDYPRAQKLAAHYAAQEGAPKSLKTALRQILEEDDRAMASRFPNASKHHSVSEARELAQRFRESGPFGLAA